MGLGLFLLPFGLPGRRLSPTPLGTPAAVGWFTLTRFAVLLVASAKTGGARGAVVFARRSRALAASGDQPRRRDSFSAHAICASARASQCTASTRHESVALSSNAASLVSRARTSAAITLRDLGSLPATRLVEEGTAATRCLSEVSEVGCVSSGTRWSEETSASRASWSTAAASSSAARCAMMAAWVLSCSACTAASREVTAALGNRSARWNSLTHWSLSCSRAGPGGMRALTCASGRRARPPVTVGVAGASSSRASPPREHAVVVEADAASSRRSRSARSSAKRPAMSMRSATIRSCAASRTSSEPNARMPPSLVRLEVTTRAVGLLSPAGGSRHKKLRRPAREGTLSFDASEDIVRASSPSADRRSSRRDVARITNRRGRFVSPAALPSLTSDRPRRSRRSHPVT